MINIKYKFLPWIPAIVWMVLIFSLSAQPATESDGFSKSITELIIETIGRILPLDLETSTTADLVSQFNHIVRKMAHFSAYLVLGSLVTNALFKSGIRGYKAFFYSMMICVLYAISDEFHQLFVPGRGGQIKDVLIDSSGALVGIIICNLASKILKKKMKIN